MASLFLSTPSGWRATLLKGIWDGVYQILFLSTPSGWRATVGVETLPPDKLISIHALRVEGDGEEMVG